MNHRIGRNLFALGVSLAVAVIAFQWITDPEPRERRQAEENAVQVSRELLRDAVGERDIEIVDPLAPNRKVGKVYVFAESPGWAISGHYRRSENDRWHAYLMRLNNNLELHAFKAQDESLDFK